MSVHVIQLLCPQRHALLALAYDDARRPYREALGDLKAAWLKARQGGANNRCGICGSRELRYEDGATRFTTLEEAAPHLAALQTRNLLTGASLRPERN